MWYLVSCLWYLIRFSLFGAVSYLMFLDSDIKLLLQFKIFLRFLCTEVYLFSLCLILYLVMYFSFLILSNFCLSGLLSYFMVLICGSFHFLFVFDEMLCNVSLFWYLNMFDLVWYKNFDRYISFLVSSLLSVCLAW